MTIATNVAICISLGFAPGVCKAETFDNLQIDKIHIDTGIASQYARGVMEKVIDVRQAGRTAHDLPLKIPNVDGFIAVLNGEDIGTIYNIRPVGQKEWETFLAVDCAGRSDGGYEFMVNGGRIDGNWYPILVEVDWQTAVRWDTIGRGILVEVRR